MSSEPKIEDNIEEPKTEKNTEEPKIEKNNEEPKKEDNIDEPKIEDNIEEPKIEKNIEEPEIEKIIEEPKIEKNIVIAGPDITQEYKNDLINKLEKLEKIISGYFLIISSVSNKMMIDLGNDIYDCERKYNYMDIELKPFSKFVKNKYNFPYLKAKMKVVKNNYLQLENAITNKILNNIVNEEKEKLLPKNQDNKNNK